MIEDIYAKRQKVINYKKDGPSSELMHELIHKTYELVASKQNLMPYKIHVLGPDCKKYKEELYKLTTKAVDEKYFRTTANVQVFAPWVLIFTARLAEPNEFVYKCIHEEGHSYQPCFPETYLNSGPIRTTCIEIGMFAKIFTGLCLEQDIDISYTKCFRSWPNNKVKDPEWAGLPFVNDPPLFVMVAGYRQEHVHIPGETKPDFDEVVCFEHE